MPDVRGALERIWPDRAEVTADDLVGEAGHVPATRPWVTGMMVSSLDGRAALGGSSRALGGPADLQMLVALRRRSDALIVGPGTVRAEGYGRLQCPAVLVSRSFDVPWDAGLFSAPGQRVLIYTRTEREPPDVAAEVEIVPIVELSDGARRPARARGRAAPVRGRPAPSTARCSRRGCSTSSSSRSPPVVAGDAEAPAIIAAGDPARLALRSVATADDELYLRYSV